MLWIVFAGAYVLIGSAYPIRIVSSLLMLVAGVLLLAVLAHIIACGDQDRVRRTLIIAFTASLFVINASVQTFKDYLASAFALVFALMLAILIWGVQDTFRVRRIQYLAFVSMSMALIAATFGLFSTIVIRSLLAHSGLGALYILAPQGTAALCGLSIGLIIGGRILSNRTAWYETLQSKCFHVAAREALLLGCPVAMLLVFANHKRYVNAFPSFVGAFPVVYCYCLILILPIAAYLAHVHRYSPASRLSSIRAFLVICGLGFLGGLSNGLLLTFATGADHITSRVFIAEGPPGAIFGIAIGLGFLLVNRVSDTVLAPISPVSIRSVPNQELDNCPTT